MKSVSFQQFRMRSEEETPYCEVVDVLARTASVPRIPSFFRALQESPTPFDATVERGARGWESIDFLLRSRRGVSLEAIRPRAPIFNDRIRELRNRAAKGPPTDARLRVLEHIEETRVLYRLKVHDWVESEDDWLFVFMLGTYLCEHGDAILHNFDEGSVDPGEGQLLRPES